MSRRWQALAAAVCLLTASVLAPKAACAAPAGSIQAAMACCRTMKRCSTAGSGHSCCRQVRSHHEQPSPLAVVPTVLPTGTATHALGTCMLQVVTAGEPNTRIAPIAVPRFFFSRSDESPPGSVVPVYILLNALLI